MLSVAGALKKEGETCLDVTSSGKYDVRAASPLLIIYLFMGGGRVKECDAMLIQTASFGY